jgi:16S rRNA G966 N2-methylase RsmD
LRFADLYPNLSSALTPSSESALRVAQPLAMSSRGSKGTAAYLAHSYPTKVPPEAIEPFLLHHTRQGDLVLDPFCGSGMTGLAARRTGRRVVLNDLSIGAVHLAANAARHADADAFLSAGQRVLERVAHTYMGWYGTTGRDGNPARIEWTLWSPGYTCAHCGDLSVLWDDAVDRETGRVASEWPCPTCGAGIVKRTAPVSESFPAWMSVTDSRGRYERPPTGEDLERMIATSEEPLEDWVPDVPLGPDREMYVRCALHLQRIENVTDFWTARNLRAVARLWAAVNEEPDIRLRQALAFAFTNTAWHATKMRRYNARGGQRPLTGTLYVPQLSIEVNPARVFANKLRQIQRFYAQEDRPAAGVRLLNGPAQALDLADSSIDYCFTDPPFGSNIFYADCAVVWESWLGAVTDQRMEAVVNKSLRPRNGGKTIRDYAGLMDAAFAEINRVLKPDGWTTVVFNSSDPEVWSALRMAVERTGFDLATASHIDKTQQSFKGYKGRSGKEDVPAFDVVLNVHKPGAVRRRPKAPGGFTQAGDVLAAHLTALPALGLDPEADRERTLPYLHSLLVRAHFNGSIGLDIGSYALVRRLCEERFAADGEGHWHLPTGRLGAHRRKPKTVSAGSAPGKA